MKAVVQRVKSASVSVDGDIVGSIDKGLLVLLGVSRNFSYEKLEWMVRKIANMRLWASEEKGFDLCVKEVGGSVLVVSQFTLFGQMDGNKPNFRDAAGYEEAEEVYERFVGRLREEGLRVETGRFGAMMEVSLVNDGPVTIILEK